MSDITKRHIVIGTAGHIDHGKSALIKSLTGIDPDRLKEEQERGMTTDLGFAFYSDDVTIIDVPGHERFVRHMLAGASTIDLVMFVIAADDGIMPQTIEHLEILRLLEIKKGIIVLTKKDLVEKDHLEMVIKDIKNLVKDSFLENSPIIPISNTTKEGVEDIKRILNEMITQTETKQGRGIFRMGIDRCFTMKGFGTVVAGTVLSGQIKVGDMIELLPQKKQIKVRGIEVHNKKVSEVRTGFRAAINLAGIEKEEIERGDVIAQIGYFEPSNYLNASLFLLKSAEKPLKNLTRLRIHLGTKEILGRVAILDKKILEPGDKAMAQFRMESPAVCDVGDRYVIRAYSPQITIGGGVIIEPKAKKVKGFDEQLIEHLHKIEERDPLTMVEENLISNFELPRKISEIAHDLNLSSTEVQGFVKELINTNKVICIDEKKEWFYAQTNFERLKNKVVEVLTTYHKNNPTRVGFSRLELLKNISQGLDNTLLGYALEEMIKNKQIKIAEDKISIFDFKIVLDKILDEMVTKIEKIYLDSGYQAPGYDVLVSQRLGPEEIVKRAYRYLVDSGILVYLGEGIIMHQKMVNEAKEKLIRFLKEKKEIRVAEFRDLLGASRKYVLPLLIYFDTHNITIRRGDFRILAEKYR